MLQKRVRSIASFLSSSIRNPLSSSRQIRVGWLPSIFRFGGQGPEGFRYIPCISSLIHQYFTILMALSLIVYFHGIRRERILSRHSRANLITLDLMIRPFVSRQVKPGSSDPYIQATLYSAANKVVQQAATEVYYTLQCRTQS